MRKRGMAQQRRTPGHMKLGGTAMKVTHTSVHEEARLKKKTQRRPSTQQLACWTTQIRRKLDERIKHLLSEPLKKK